MGLAPEIDRIRAAPSAADAVRLATRDTPHRGVPSAPLKEAGLCFSPADHLA